MAGCKARFWIIAIGLVAALPTGAFARDDLIVNTSSPADPAQAVKPGHTRLTVRLVPKDKIKFVAYEAPTGLMFFRAVVAGREVWAMLDNGAGRTIIDIALARAAGLMLVASDQKLKTPTAEIAK